jgi:hypothetical protein
MITEDFLIKLDKASIDLHNLNLRSNSTDLQGSLLINHYSELIKILNLYFSHENELEGHLVNYFKLIVQERKLVPVKDGIYWLYRSAIASLSKYFRPSIEILMTHYYEISLRILQDNLNQSIDEPTDRLVKIKNACNRINLTIEMNISIKGDEARQKKCRILLSLSIDSFINNLESMNDLTSYSPCLEFSKCLIKTIITNTDIPLTM